MPALSLINYVTLGRTLRMKVSSVQKKNDHGASEWL
jgi:hypothetical protein